MSEQEESRRVLIVDDEPQVRNALARLLRAHGLEPLVAASGEEALALAEGERLLAVVSDLKMPGMGGVVLLQRLSPLQPSVRFVVLTGAGAVDTQWLPQGHKVRVIHKPWQASELLTAVLGRRSTGQSSLPPAPAKAGRTRVLLLENDPTDALLAQTALRLSTSQEHQVTHAVDLKSALSLLRYRKFDAACVELSLPDADGLEAVLKVQAAAPEMGIVVLSHEEDESMALQAVQAGAQDFLIKGQVGGAAIAKAIRYAQERKRAEQRLSEMAFHDQLTHLANRTLFRQRIAQAIVRTRERGGHFAVLLLDLDRFKAVNDALGHDAGDTFLQQVAERLRLATRESETLARLGGDEFAVLAEGLKSQEDVPILCDRILKELRRPLEISGTRLRSTASIGAAIYPESGQDSDGLLAAADAAMYVAKSEGRNGYHIHGVELSRSSARRIALEHRLREAVEHGDFELHYQPQVRGDGTWLGAEALLRWVPDDGPPVPADQFVPILEETGLILELGAWVIDRSCKQLRAWRDAGCDLERVGINISAIQFAAGDVVEDIRRATRDSGLPPSSVELELTETALIHDTESIREKLTKLARDGHRLALDDFGTGYCSLAYLQHFPISTVKIDKSFIREVATDKRLRELVGGIVHLAGRLGLEVVAEGVESQAQLQVLDQESCGVMQGYLFGKAVPPEEFFRQFLAQQKAGHSRVVPAS